LSKEFSDIHALIAATAQNYQFCPMPPFVLQVEEAFTKLTHYLLDLIASLLMILPGVTDTRAASEIMKMLLYLTGMGAAFLLLWFLWSRLSELGKQARLAQARQAEDQSPKNSGQWYLAALELSKKKQWREASRALLLACIRLFDEKQLVPFIANRTNAEYWYALAGQDNVRASFRYIFNRVDSVWFGNQEAKEEDFRGCLADFEMIKAALSDQSQQSEGIT